LSKICIGCTDNQAVKKLEACDHLGAAGEQEDFRPYGTRARPGLSIGIPAAMCNLVDSSKPELLAFERSNRRFLTAAQANSGAYEVVDPHAAPTISRIPFI
jgi:hypothetical protein